MTAPLHLHRGNWRFDRRAYRRAVIAPALRHIPAIALAALAVIATIALWMAATP